MKFRFVGFRIERLGYRVSGKGFGVSDSEFEVWACRFRPFLPSHMRGLAVLWFKCFRFRVLLGASDWVEFGSDSGG